MWQFVYPSNEGWSKQELVSQHQQHQTDLNRFLGMSDCWHQDVGVACDATHFRTVWLHANLEWRPLSSWLITSQIPQASLWRPDWILAVNNFVIIYIMCFWPHAETAVRNDTYRSSGRWLQWYNTCWFSFICEIMH